MTDSKINPSRENYAYFIPCKPPHKNHPREYFGTTLCFIQIATSVVGKSQILSVAFHLSATVWVMGNCSYMGYEALSPANQLSGLKNVWNLREYGVCEPWVTRESTVL